MLKLLWKIFGDNIRFRLKKFFYDIRWIEYSVLPDDIIASELISSNMYKAYKEAKVFKVIAVKETYDDMIVYDRHDSIEFKELTEAVVYLHNKTLRDPKTKYDILPM